MDPLSAALELAFSVIRSTVSPYVGGDFNLRIEAEVHNKVNDELKKISGDFIFRAETIFDYKTEEFVSTLHVKDKRGSAIPKPITITHNRGIKRNQDDLRA